MLKTVTITALVPTFEGGQFLLWSLQSIKGLVDRVVILRGSTLDSPIIGLGTDDTESIVEIVKKEKWFDKVEFHSGVFDTEVDARNFLLSKVEKGDWYMLWDDDHIMLPLTVKDEPFQSWPVDRQYIRWLMTGSSPKSFQLFWEHGKQEINFMFKRGYEKYISGHWSLMEEGLNAKNLYTEYGFPTSLMALHMKHQRYQWRKDLNFLTLLLKYEQRWSDRITGLDAFVYGVVPKDWKKHKFDYRYMTYASYSYRFRVAYYSLFGSYVDETGDIDNALYYLKHLDYIKDRWDSYGLDFITNQPVRRI